MIEAIAVFLLTLFEVKQLWVVNSRNIGIVSNRNFIKAACDKLGKLGITLIAFPEIG